MHHLLQMDASDTRGFKPNVQARILPCMVSFDQFRRGDGQSDTNAAQEQELRNAFEAEEDIGHQMQKRAILLNVETNQKTRTETVRGL